MKKKLIILILCTISLSSFAQKVTLDPVITPSLFRYNDQITVTYDVTGTPLASLTTAWSWVWIPGATNLNAKYNFNPASSNATQTDNAKFTKSVVSGRTLFTLTFKPSDFFTSDISTQTKFGILLKGNDWANGQTTDYLTDFWDGSFQVKLTSPTQQPIFVTNGDDITIQAETPLAADYTLFINDVQVDVQNGITAYSYSHSVTETSGYATVKLVAAAGGNSDEIIFQYLISVESPESPRPTGIIAGINYSADNSKVTLCLWAPDKSSVYTRGDFSDWKVLPQNLMKRDGEFFWIELAGLISGQEYAFQYLINENVVVADPYADKILDPDDQYIPASVYPNLKPFPSAVLNEEWYFNRASVLQTAQTPYNWQVTNFEKPEKEKLVVYELLIRDFFGPNAKSYQSMVDTLSYFKTLGINAIELMPIMEFNGNESWGYNPAFMFAPDKYYGTKNKLKEFIDKCHQNGIAVILDIAMNHADMPNPYVMMDFNFDTGKPTPANKWFNPEAKHPFNVFFDMNHESLYTKTYLDTVNHYWLNEFKVDGFRFDLSKGFTQTNNPSDVNAWSAYDASRIAILKRMADKIWEHTPDAYVILEHLSVNAEEKELAEYRASEGKGMMLWGNLNNAYAQSAMGFTADITGAYHATRGWNVPHLVSYMESHDEERLMYRNLQSGKTTPNYDIKSLATALKRVEAASTIFYTIPGPKMLWQFGELGYDYSINHCPDGSNNEGCRVSPKPVKWEYQQDPQRQKLSEHISDLIRLRNAYDVFTDGTATITGGGNLLKHLMLKNNPYTATPTSAGEMNAIVVVNFDVSEQSFGAEFPHTGTWYDYYSGGRAIAVTSSPSVLALKAGEYKLFTDYPIESPVVTGINSGVTGEGMEEVSVYPNPVENILTVKKEGSSELDLVLFTSQGSRVVLPRVDDHSWDTSRINTGLYIAEVRTGGKIHRIKVLKR
jgi:1,4-alpha-glucan branching enzyme